MIKTVGFSIHKPLTNRVVRNNTSEGNNTIFYNGIVIPGYNRFGQGYNIGWLSFSNSVFRSYSMFWPRGTNIKRNSWR